mgnify:CR=1 FL=1
MIGKDLIPIGLRRITKMTAREDRFLIYLPESLNDLWKWLHAKRIKINVYIELPEEEIETNQKEFHRDFTDEK